MARRNQRADAPKDPYAAITEERFFARTRVEFFASENFERNSYSREATPSLRAMLSLKDLSQATEGRKIRSQRRGDAEIGVGRRLRVSARKSLCLLGTPRAWRERPLT